MSTLSGLATETESTEIKGETDSVGMGGPLESDIYLSTIDMAYLSKSKGGALSLNVHFTTEEGRSSRQQLWLTSGDAKGNKNFYETKDGDKKFLPGFIHANALCLLTVGKEINKITLEEKVIKVYSPEAQGEVPTKVEVLTDLLGQQAYLGIQKQIVDKNVKADNGSYVPSGDTREVNELDKVFRAKDKKTTTEVRAQAEEASFFETWLKKHKGNVIDRAKGAKGGAQSGAPAGRAPLNSGAPNPFAGGGASQPAVNNGGAGMFG